MSQMIISMKSDGHKMDICHRIIPIKIIFLNLTMLNIIVGMSWERDKARACRSIRGVLRSIRMDESFCDLDRRGNSSAATVRENNAGKPRRARCATLEKTA